MEQQHIKTEITGHDNIYTVDKDGTILNQDAVPKGYQFVAGSPGEFVLMYTSVLNILSQWKLTQASICLYAYLLEKYSDSSVFTINQTIRKELAERSGKSETTFINCTRELLSLKLMACVGYKTYRLNPIYAFKGRTDQQKLAVFELSEQCPGLIEQKTVDFFRTHGNKPRNKSKKPIEGADPFELSLVKKHLSQHGL